MSSCKGIPSLPGYYASLDGRIFGANGIEIKISEHWNRGRRKSGYKTVWAMGKHRKVHRLVAEAIIPNPDGKPWVNHIDGDKGNNRASNLEWSTPLENCRHARVLHKQLHCEKFELKNNNRSRAKRGENNPRSKLSDEQVKELRMRYEAGKELVKSLALEFGISKRHVASIANGKYREVSN